MMTVNVEVAIGIILGLSGVVGIIVKLSRIAFQVERNAQTMEKIDIKVTADVEELEKKILAFDAENIKRFDNKVSKEMFSMYQHENQEALSKIESRFDKFEQKMERILERLEKMAG
jgi:hypothetical protein